MHRKAHVTATSSYNHGALPPVTLCAPAGFRNGLKILLDNNPHEIIYFQHVTPVKGHPFFRTKLRDLTSGETLERTFGAENTFVVLGTPMPGTPMSDTVAQYRRVLHS